MKAILEYMGLGPNDYCECETNLWHSKPINPGDWSGYGHCKKPLPPDYPNSLDAQQPVIEKMVAGDLIFKLIHELKRTWDGGLNQYIRFEELLIGVSPQTRYKAIMKVLENESNP